VISASAAVTDTASVSWSGRSYVAFQVPRTMSAAYSPAQAARMTAATARATASVARPGWRHAVQIATAVAATSTASAASCGSENWGMSLAAGGGARHYPTE
jgi:hypothetical protein